jgi:hypothetical protein
MSKLLTALLLSSISLSASAAVTPSFYWDWQGSYNEGIKSYVVPPPANYDDAVFGGRFYVVDASKPIEFTFVTSHATYDHEISIGITDADGNLVWTVLYEKQGWSSGPNDGSTYTLNIFDAAASGYFTTASEVFFRIVSAGGTFYSGDPSGNIDNFAHVVSFYNYHNGQTLVSFEDLLDGGDLNFDDFVMLVSNISSIPEPETYVMLLTGLGIIGAIARRRKAAERS